MKRSLDPIAEYATNAARAALPESVIVGDATLLPRGADPFIGSARPTLLAATRWAFVSPGGVLIGGDPEGLAAMFGFEVPEKPAPVAAEDRKPGTPPPPKWADLVVEESRAALTTFSHAVANAVITLSGLPPDLAPTQLSLGETDAEVRSEVGPVADAVVLLLHADGHEARVVVVIPGIFMARMRGEAEAPVIQAHGGAPVDLTDDLPVPALEQLSTRPLDAALAKVPLDLAIELGRARVPLAQVLHLQEGEVLELRQTIDAPVDLVCEAYTVACGELEVDTVGNLVLHVTSVPSGAKPRPQVVPVPMESLAQPDDSASDGSEAGGVAAQDEPIAAGGVDPLHTDAPGAASSDLGSQDVGTPDIETPDAGIPSVGTSDAGTPDAGTPDAGTPDAGTPDVGTPDVGTPDAEAPPAP